MILHEQDSDFKDLIRLTAQHMKIREAYVEKDYWVTFLLKRITTIPNSHLVVFKGGTSLSKAYGLIKRFSEDVDLAVIKESSMNNTTVENFIRDTSKILTKNPFEEFDEEGTTSKKGMNRRTLHKYPRTVESSDFGPVRDKVLLELNCFDTPTPNDNKLICSFIADFLRESGQSKSIRTYQLESFSIKVLDYRRTFVEKILSLTYSSFEDGSEEIGEVRARVRHFYDLTILMREKEIANFLKSSDFADLTKKVRSEENLSSRTKWKEKRLSTAALHSTPKKLLAKIEAVFKSDLEPMVFQATDLPDFKDVRTAFKAISKVIKDSDL
ncbi:MAG TPA: nucleotidyl transferase AbiEii/AbiGii toxin family protein [Bdellovibrio sp.]|nr:nucleotidyl transferase AbiEii/AbiGii toxin family protein [Bdellovibrio sp.]